jgi:hypothetical protein
VQLHIAVRVFDAPRNDTGVTHAIRYQGSHLAACCSTRMLLRLVGPDSKFQFI